MHTLQQSFSWWSFFREGRDADALLTAAARLGYAGVEMIPEALWATARQHGLTIATISGHQSLGNGLNRRENHDRIEGELRANLDKAVANGIPNLIVFSGNRGGLSDAEGLEATVEGLGRVVTQAEDAGVTLVLELLNSRVDHPDYQADHTEWGVRVCEAVDSPRVKLLYDIYHMQVMEGDVIATIRKHAAHFGHYHSAGVPGRRDLDETQELNYPAIVQAIVATGYEGYLGHEFVPQGEAVAALEAAFHTCAVG
jgi:hydroxypyruvate isomerase